MPVGHHHLIHVERCPIHARLHRGWSKREMVRDPGRDPGTISRETSRHRGQRGDRRQQADGQATTRRQEPSAMPRRMTPECWAVAGRRDGGQEWIDSHVRAGRQAGGTRYRCLRRLGKKPNGRSHIPDRVDLAERPAVVAEKSRIGDWEREPILGARHRGRWCRQWIGARSSGSWSGWTGRPRQR